MDEKRVAESGPDTREWFIGKHPSDLMDLPYSFRWEVTRRHPYYLQFWQLASRHYTQPSQDPRMRDSEELACLILRLIGVSGEPPAPSSTSDSLKQGSLGSVWESGAVTPLTFRALLCVLAQGLPRETLMEVSALLLRWSGGDCFLPKEVSGLLMKMEQLQHPGLDAVPNICLLGINLHAPLRLIQEKVVEQVQRWKQQEGIAEKRRRDDKLQEYMTVWDLREGWVVDQYDSNQERTFQAIAQQLGIPFSTVANRYRSAFKLIVGRQYSPELWAHLFGIHKTCAWIRSDEIPKRTTHRPWTNRRPRSVPDSVLREIAYGEETTGILDSYVRHQPDFTVLVADITHLVEHGKSNAQIRDELELHAEGSEKLINYFRRRKEDRLTQDMFEPDN